LYKQVTGRCPTLDAVCALPGVLLGVMVLVMVPGPLLVAALERSGFFGPGIWSFDLLELEH